MRLNPGGTAAWAWAGAKSCDVKRTVAVDVKKVRLADTIGLDGRGALRAETDGTKRRMRSDKQRSSSFIVIVNCEEDRRSRAAHGQNSLS